MKRLLSVVVVLALAIAAIPVRAQDEAQMCPDDQPPILIGTTVSLTGEFEYEGEDVLQGYELWVDWVNEEFGGVEVGNSRRCVGLIYRDDKSDPDTVTALTEELITKDKVSFLLAPYSSALTEKAVAVSERHHMLMLSGNAAADSLFDNHVKYFFGVQTPASLYSKAALESAHKLGAKTMVIAYKDEPFSHSVADGAQHWAKELGMDVLAVQSFEPGAPDFADWLTKFRDLKPDLFLGAGHFRDSVQFIQQAKIVGFSPAAFILTVGPSLMDFVELLGPDAEFVWGLTQWEPSMTWKDNYFGNAADYSHTFMDKYKQPANYQNAQATAAALVLHLAIERAGTLNTDDVREALLHTNVNTFYGPIKFDQRGSNDAKLMAATQVQKGKIVLIAPDEMALAKPIYPAPPWKK